MLEVVANLVKQPAYLQYKGRPLLSTFGGESAAFGGSGWEGWLKDLSQSLGDQASASLRKPIRDGPYHPTAVYKKHTYPQELLWLLAVSLHGR